MTYIIVHLAGLGSNQPGREASCGMKLAPRYHGGLWQARRAGCVDENGHRLHLVAAAEVVREPLRLSLRDLLSALEREDVEVQVRQFLAHMFVDVVGHGLVNQAESTPRSLEAMRKGVPSQVVVHEGGLCADRPEAEPYEDVDIAVREIHPDNVALLDAKLCLEPVAISQHYFVTLSIAVRFVLEQEEGPSGGLLGQSLGLEVVVETQLASVLAPVHLSDGGEDAGEHAEVVPQGESRVEICGSGRRGGHGQGKWSCDEGDMLAIDDPGEPLHDVDAR